MGFDRMRIPFIRSLSGSAIGERSWRAKSRSRLGSSAHIHSHTQAKQLPPSATTSSNLAADAPELSLTLPSPSPPIPRLPQNASQVAMPRKIWVKRPGASATRVEIHEDDLVDNVRDSILQKYANSLGRTIDSPDVGLKIVSRDPLKKFVAAERLLGPEEQITQVLEDNFPGGQTIEDALIVDVPKTRTPRPSPRPGNHQNVFYYPDHFRPDDAARDYFGPMQAMGSPHLAHVPHAPGHTHSMNVLTTGQLPNLPSPGAHSTRRRPKAPRQHTSSPTILHSSQPNGQLMEPKVQINGAQPAPSMPTPPAANEHKPSITPPNRAQSPHPGQRLKKKKNLARSASGDPQAPLKPASASLLDGTVPPINVLLVEDNVINLKLLEAFMKRLKVRWKSAMNGKEAVAMWRTGGFHLVLMDIQLPVMNGLDATKEIRRLEAVNRIGVFSGSPIEGDEKMSPYNRDVLGEEDKLHDRSLFKSPVIIVALTASSLQSDRHEALAAGCNDFLTKPVGFLWLERKVTEWGCMQALIDFDGWRKWKEYAKAKEEQDPAKKAAEEKEEKAKAKAALQAMFARPPPGSTPKKAEERKDSAQPNGTLKKPGPSSARNNKNSRSSGSNGANGGLGVVGEVDESLSR